MYTCSNKMSMLKTADYPDSTSVANPLSQPVVLSHSQLELGNMKVFPQLFPSIQCYSWKHSLVILFESPLAAETLIWNIASCTPRKSKSFTGPPVTQEPGGQHGRNCQPESPKWRNEIRFPWRGGLLECNENKPHPSSPAHTHTHPRGFCKATGTEIISFESIKH